MSTNIPHLVVPRMPARWNAGVDFPAWDWTGATTLPQFILADGSGPAIQQTIARICYNQQALFVRFDCDDSDIWGTGTRRDDPIYDEEVVEVFIGPGATTPVDYYEFEVSPNGVMLDLNVHNPDSQRSTIKLDASWDCPGLQWVAERDDTNHHWWAIMVFPWASIGATVDLPKIWRANFYRIERPRDAEPEFSCWSPTMTEPADYHKPEYFGVLELA